MTRTAQSSRSRLIARTLLITSGMALLTGCVASDTHESTVEAANALEARNAEQAQRIQELEQALQLRDNSDTALRDENARLRQERSQLQSDIDQLNDRIMQVGEDMQGLRFGGLDPATDAALRRLASRYSDLMSYDAASGRVLFASDLTFPSGSDQIRDTAKQGLADLARILDTSDASLYLVYIEGHTDAQVPSNPNTLKNHPTNRHLSAHRAIAVGRLLTQQGLSASRLFTGGWGAARPAVPNTQNGNTPANRRVEIYLVPPRDDAPATAPTSGSTGRTTPSARPDAPMK